MPLMHKGGLVCWGERGEGYGVDWGEAMSKDASRAASPA